MKTITWVGIHRLHHQETDRKFDPHSPNVSLLWAHFLWTFFPHPFVTTYQEREKYTKDLLQFPEIIWLEHNFLAINLVFLALLFLSGFLVNGWCGALAWFSCIGCLRICITWHLTFIVNAVNHRWGYRNYETPDNSRNNILISILVFFGEGWHNNHHAEPKSARHGHRWFEFDLAYLLICLLQKLHLIWDVQLPRIPQTINGTS